MSAVLNNIPIGHKLVLRAKTEDIQCWNGSVFVVVNKYPKDGVVSMRCLTGHRPGHTETLALETDRFYFMSFDWDD